MKKEKEKYGKHKISQGPVLLFLAKLITHDPDDTTFLAKKNPP